MSSQKQKTFEFRLSDVAWKLLSQWKALMLFSLVFAVLACGLHYKQSIKTYNAEKKAAEEAAKLAELTPEERIETELSRLPDSERSIVEYILNEQDWVDEQFEYLNNSIAMNSNPTSQRTLKIVFDINTEKVTDPAALLDTYKVFAYSEDIISAIKPIVSPDVEDKYIGELLTPSIYTTGGDANGAFEVKVVLPQETDANAVAGVIEDVYKAYSKRLNSKIKHELSLTDKSVGYEYHLENVNKRIAIFNQVNSIGNNLRNVTDSLTEQQRKVLNAISTAKSDAKKTDKGGDTSKIAIPKKSGYSIKYALLGFLMGAIIYAFAYLGLVLIRARVFSAGDLEYFTRTRKLGEVYYEKNVKGLQALTHSRFIERLHHKGKLDIAKQIGIIADSTKGICEHIGKGKATFINLSHEGTADETINSIIESAGAKNLSFDTVKIESAADEGKLSKVEDAILIVPEGIKASELWNIDTLCNSYDVNRLGCVWVGEV